MFRNPNDPARPVSMAILTWQKFAEQGNQWKTTPLNKKTKYSFLHVELGKKSRGADWNSQVLATHFTKYFKSRWKNNSCNFHEENWAPISCLCTFQLN